MRLLVIDNYDSFTYNVVQYLGELGSEVEIIRNDCADANSLDFGRFNGLVISPGPCDPDKAGISLNAIDLQRIIPILGICLGHQCISQFWWRNCKGRSTDAWKGFRY